jgi:sodium-dependent dicarboxylate transporter 2/3/5
MWISNTATAMMMIPNVMSIMKQVEALPNQDTAVINKMSGGFYLGLAYSASVGGVATKIGTPPNLVLMRVYQLLFPDAPEITFATWFGLGFPISLILMLTIWVGLVFRDMPKASDTRMQIPYADLKQKYTNLGPWTREEGTIATCFLFLACLWFTRASLGEMAGWSSYFENPKYLRDGTTAIGVSFLLFCLPAHDPSLMPPNEGGGVAARPWNSKMLSWNDAKKLPWDMVLLFGGGFALANGFIVSGLSDFLGEQLVSLGGMPLFGIVLLLALITTFLTEITSNTATSNVLLPIVAALAVAINVHPLVLMIPTAMSCSFAFMMPMATPPNLLAFATGKLTIIEMCKHGIFINFFAVGLVTLATFTIIPAVLQFDPAVIPDWAISKA